VWAVVSGSSGADASSPGRTWIRHHERVVRQPMTKRWALISIRHGHTGSYARKRDGQPTSCSALGAFGSEQRGPVVFLRVRWLFGQRFGQLGHVRRSQCSQDWPRLQRYSRSVSTKVSRIYALTCSFVWRRGESNSRTSCMPCLSWRYGNGRRCPQKCALTSYFAQRTFGGIRLGPGGFGVGWLPVWLPAPTVPSPDRTILRRWCVRTVLLPSGILPARHSLPPTLGLGRASRDVTDRAGVASRLPPTGTYLKWGLPCR